MRLTDQDLMTIRDASNLLSHLGLDDDLVADLDAVGDKLADQLKADIDTPNPRRAYDLDGDRYLEVVLTHEGVIMDAYQLDNDSNDQLVGTIGRMADEWWEYIDGQ